MNQSSQKALHLSADKVRHDPVHSDYLWLELILSNDYDDKTTTPNCPVMCGSVWVGVYGLIWLGVGSSDADSLESVQLRTRVRSVLNYHFRVGSGLGLGRVGSGSYAKNSDCSAQAELIKKIINETHLFIAT